MSQYGFDFKVRMAQQVASAVAEEVINNTSYGRKFGVTREREIRPVILSISSPESKNEVVFRYKGGIVVRILMFDLGSLNESWRTPPTESWVVYQANILYYPRDPVIYQKLSGQKILRIWDGEKLEKLKKVRWWDSPPVRMKEGIQSDVGIFVDRAAWTGFVEADYECNQQGHAILWKSIPYEVLVDGDQERAIEEAKSLLREFLESA